MNRLRADLQVLLDEIPMDLGGGCTLSKAYMLVWLIRRYNLKRTVDIGVYRGRSFFPQAWAHRRFTGGVVYGVDPWSAAEALENDNPALRDKIAQWVQQLDFQAVYEDVQGRIERHHLGEHCVLLRQTSVEAHAFFETSGISFDLVHIDGNHDTATVLSDVRLYTPHLSANGFVVLDDVSWSSVQPAYRELAAAMPCVFRRSDRVSDYAVFWNGAGRPGRMTRRFLCWLVGRGVL